MLRGNKKLDVLSRQLTEKYGAGLCLFDDCSETLTRLAESYRLGIVSNASSYSKSFISAFGLRPHFDHVVLSCEAKAMKPDSEIYFAAIRLFGVEPWECVFVGDGADDEIIGAKRVGMTSIVVDWKLPHSEQVKRHADWIFSSLREVGDFLCDPEWVVKE